MKNPPSPMPTLEDMDATIQSMRRAKWRLEISSKEGGGFTASFLKTIEVGGALRSQRAIGGEADGRTMPEAVVKAAKHAKDYEIDCKGGAK